MKTMMMRVMVAVCAAGCAGGCARVNNERVAGLDAGRALEPATGASVAGVSRANWERRVFVVERDAAEHRPIYTALGPTGADASAMQTGGEPTAGDAFAWEDDRGVQLAEGIAGPIVAGWEVLTMPVRMILRWPGSVVRDGGAGAGFDLYHEPTASFDLGTMSEGEVTP